MRGKTTEYGRIHLTIHGMQCMRVLFCSVLFCLVLFVRPHARPAHENVRNRQGKRLPSRACSFDSGLCLDLPSCPPPRILFPFPVPRCLSLSHPPFNRLSSAMEPWVNTPPFSRYLTSDHLIRPSRFDTCHDVTIRRCTHKTVVPVVACSSGNISSSNGSRSSKLRFVVVVFTPSKICRNLVRRSRRAFPVLRGHITSHYITGRTEKTKDTHIKVWYTK